MTSLFENALAVPELTASALAVKNIRITVYLLLTINSDTG